MKATTTFLRPRSMENAADFMAGKIAGHLASGEKVLWLVSGGSAIKLAVEAARLLKSRSDLSNLSVSLADERFGEPGHTDSNWQQLMEAGFELDEARLLPVLSGKSLEETAADYGRALEKALETADYSIALAGIGPDGHTFGIKPGSPAVDSRQLVVGFEWDDFKRLTPTAELIKHLDEIVVYAFGAEKRQQLEDLAKELPISKQPAQVLKSIAKLTILNDYKGDEI